MASFKEKSFAERRQTADEARKALLSRFKARPSDDDPEVQKKKAERLAIAEAREQREAERKRLKLEKAEQEAREKAEREAAAELEANAEALARESAEKEMIAKLLADEAERKEKRDARYAARKARVGR